jgi:dolichol-phosphate mannosyltransferase
VSPPLVSVIAPILNEEQVLPELLARLRALRDAHPELRFEFLLVDDGSTDRTPELLRAAAAADPDLKVIALSRNFGHQQAISAGLDFARGDVAAVIDADLQDPPEMIPGMLELWRQGADVVYAVRRSRQEPLLLRGLYRLFYRLLRWSAHIEIQLDAGDCCLLDRRVLEVLKQIPDRSRFLRGLRAWVGFDQRPYLYDRAPRGAGTPKYTYRKLVSLALDGLISFSELPLRLGTWVGVALVAASGLYAVVAGVVSIISWESRPRGFATLAIALTFLSGVQLVVISLLGEYVLRVFNESKRRPLYVVKQVQNLGDRPEPPILGVVAPPASALRPGREDR